MDPNKKLMANQGEPLRNPKRYRRLVLKLSYVTITTPYLTFPMGIVVQFMQNSFIDHWNAIIDILRYLKKTPGQRFVVWR